MNSSPKLQSSKNYDLFKLCQFNRDVQKIEKLKTVMRREGWIPAYPMHVRRTENGKLEIIGGHHRFCAAKEIGIAVWYVVCDDAATIFELEEGTNPWKVRDFLQAYCRNGSEDHQKLLEFMNRTGIGLTQSASMLGGQSAGSGHKTKYVKDGSFVVKDTDKAEAVGLLVRECKALGIDYASHRQFVAAFSLLLWVPEFDSKVFLHRLATNPGLIRKVPTTDEALAEIEKVYNHRANSKVSLAFLAKEAARDRNAVGKKPSQKPDV